MTRANAMKRAIAGTMLVVFLIGVAARGQGFNRQIILPGSTPQGDYLRGVGVAAAGMGAYNQQTAIANQLSAQTFIMLNEYIWNAYKNEMRENAEYRKAVLAKHAEAYRQRQEQIRNHPSQHAMWMTEKP